MAAELAKLEKLKMLTTTQRKRRNYLRDPARARARASTPEALLTSRLRKRAERHAAGATPRRTNEAQAEHYQEIYDIVKQIDGDKTIRRIFYRCVANNIIPNTLTNYKLLDQVLAEWRRNGFRDDDEFTKGGFILALDEIVDEGREIDRLDTWDSLGDFLKDARHWHRRSIWTDHDERPVILLEKRALAPLFREVTQEYQVPLVPLGGNASHSLLGDIIDMVDEWDHEARTFFYCFGDFDPHGKMIMEVAERDIQFFSREVQAVEFETVALTREQVRRYRLPPQPLKESNIAHTWSGDETVELDALDALHPEVLPQLIREVILRHLPDEDRLEEVREAENADRDRLIAIAKRESKR